MVDVGELEEFELFADLDDEELRELAKTASIAKVGAGVDVFTENQEAVTLYMVMAGEVEISMRSRRGQVAVVDLLGPGDLFGWSAILGDRTLTAGARTTENSVLLAFDGEELRRLFAKDHRLGHRVTRTIVEVISSRLHNLRTRLVDEPFAPEWLSPPVPERHADMPLVAAASEMRGVACPDCRTVNHPRGMVNLTSQYRCRTCGMVYYSPAGCETPVAARG